MSQDDTIKALLVSYEKTAQKLSDGERISDEELFRFMGLTGILSVQMQRQLWTQEELRKQIEDCQAKRCETCPNSKALALLTAKDNQRAAEETKPLKTIIITSLVANMKTLIITTGTVVVILGLAITFTHQIAAAAGFVETTTQAVSEAHK